MSYVLDRHGLAACPDDPARTADYGSMPGEAEAPDCIDLDPTKVFTELAFCVKHDRAFLGMPANYWTELISEHAQAIADEMDPDECERWEVPYMEWRS